MRYEYTVQKRSIGKLLPMLLFCYGIISVRFSGCPWPRWGYSTPMKTESSELIMNFRLFSPANHRLYGGNPTHRAPTSVSPCTFRIHTSSDRSFACADTSARTRCSYKAISVAQWFRLGADPSQTGSPRSPSAGS